MPSDPANSAEQAIHDFHVFLADWFNGRVANDKALLERRLADFVPDFRVVSAGGNMRGVDSLRGWLGHAHGSQKGATIEIRNVAIRRAEQAFVLATYEEHQTTSKGSTRKLCSATFVPDAATPGAYRWLHLHETSIS